VLRHVKQQRQLSRRAIFKQFRHDPEREVGAVLNDLVGSGLLYHTGQGLDSLYGVTSETDLRRLAEEGAVETSVPRVWSAVHERGPIARAELQRALNLPDAAFEAAVAALLAEGKLVANEQDGVEQLSCADLFVPVGAEIGWELAVFDHFRAVVSALSAKVRAGAARAKRDDVVGGATLRFHIAKDHPFEPRVRALLADVRQQVNALWDAVEAHNAAHPIDEGDAYGVYFYFGQYVQDESNGEGEADA
jgi:hypothetical protein